MERSDTFIGCTIGAYRDFSIQVGDGQFGLTEWSEGASTIYIYREVVTLPLGISGVVFIQLAGLVLLACVYFRLKNRFYRFRDDAAEQGRCTERRDDVDSF